METLIELREFYYKAILKLTEPEDIKKALPDPNYINFSEVSGLLLTKLYEDSNFCKEEYEKCDNEEDKEFYNSLYKISLLKIDLLQKKIDNFYSVLSDEYGLVNIDKELDEDIIFTNNEEFNLVFATTSSDKIYFEQDLKKNIPKEKYKEVLDLLNQLKNGGREDNPEKGGMYTSISKKLKGIHKIKGFKIRIYYKRLAKDTIYVMLLRMKKANNDSIDRQELEERNKILESQYKFLKEQINNISFKSKLIEDNNDILIRINEELGGNKYER